MTNIVTRAIWAVQVRRERAAEARRVDQTNARHQELADTGRGRAVDGPVPFGQPVHHVNHGDGHYVKDYETTDGQEPWSGFGCFPAVGDHYDWDKPADRQDPQRYQLHGAMHHDLLIVTNDHDTDEP